MSEEVRRGVRTAEDCCDRPDDLSPKRPRLTQPSRNSASAAPSASSAASSVASSVAATELSSSLASRHNSLCFGRPEAFNDAFPPYQRPREIGSFSLDGSRKWRSHESSKHVVPASRRGLPVFREPTIGVNLAEGYDRAVIRSEDDKEYIDSILHWMGENQDVVSGIQPDVVCWRGLLTKMLSLPYEPRPTLVFDAIKSGDIIYLCEWETPGAAARRRGRRPEHKLWCYMGYRFEHYCTEPDDSAGKRVVNTNEGFCSVVTTKLGSTRLLAAGEVDCCDENGAYMELKTCAAPRHPRQLEALHRSKMMKWWGQCFLLGIPMVLCGYRDEDGSLEKTETYPTSRLHKHADTWRPNVCMNFLDRVVSSVQSNVSTSTSAVRFQVDQSTRCLRVDRCSGEPFLPHWWPKEGQTRPRPLTGIEKGMPLSIT